MSLDALHDTRGHDVTHVWRTTRSRLTITNANNWLSVRIPV